MSKAKDKKDGVQKTKKSASDPPAVTEKAAEMDPTLALLFANSSGPIAAPARTKAIPKKSVQVAVGELQQLNHQNSDEEDEDTATSSSGESRPSDDDIDLSQSRSRKRRRLNNNNENLEATYFDRLAREDAVETAKRHQTHSVAQTIPPLANREYDENDSDDGSASSASNDLEDLSDLEQEDAVPQHESLGQSNTEYEKTRRTVFLGNVSTEAIKSKWARKQLETHLKSVLDTKLDETIESLRFRSTAYDITTGPKKAAYAKKELMDDTSKSTNAYVVLSKETAARKVAKMLNGTVILHRHLHTDWLAHPTAVDHKRCVFVGNLNFVDLESNVDSNNQSEEKSKRRPKAREPADADEGLWRTFSKCGVVESVRVVRDPVTRVGKGFAYVQFVDEVASEKALALDGKRFPPMLPRTLRVLRAKRILKKDLKRKRDGSDERKPSKMKGSSARKGANGKMRARIDGGVVFEGYRASADNKMKFRSKTRSKSKAGKPETKRKTTTKDATASKPSNRSSRRGAAFKAGGGKKKRDTE